MDAKLILQIVGVALGLLYLYWEYRADIRLWIVGLIMPMVHGALYYRSGLYADFGMQMYYIAAGLYGWMVWARSGHTSARSSSSDSDTGAIMHTPLRQVPILVVAALLIQGAIYWVLVRFTNSTVPYWDSLTTGFCVVAYWMLARKQAEQWLVWLAVDLLTVGLYLYKDIPLTALLYLLYAALAVAGYRQWLRMIGR